MVTSIDDFMKEATDEQKQVLFDLVELGEQENTIFKKYNKKIKPYSKMAKEANPMKESQYAKIIKEDAEDFALLATIKERDRKSTRLNSSHTDISRMPSSA